MTARETPADYQTAMRDALHDQVSRIIAATILFAPNTKGDIRTTADRAAAEIIAIVCAADRGTP